MLERFSTSAKKLSMCPNNLYAFVDVNTGYQPLSTLPKQKREFDQLMQSFAGKSLLENIVSEKKTLAIQQIFDIFAVEEKLAAIELAEVRSAMSLST